MEVGQVVFVCGVEKWIQTRAHTSQDGLDLMYIPLVLPGIVTLLKVMLRTQLCPTWGGTEPMDAPTPVITMCSMRMSAEHTTGGCRLEPPGPETMSTKINHTK